MRSIDCLGAMVAQRILINMHNWWSYNEVVNARTFAIIQHFVIQFFSVCVCSSSITFHIIQSLFLFTQIQFHVELLRWLAVLVADKLQNWKTNKKKIKIGSCHLVFSIIDSVNEAKNYIHLTVLFCHGSKNDDWLIKRSWIFIIKNRKASKSSHRLNLFDFFLFATMMQKWHSFWSQMRRIKTDLSEQPEWSECIYMYIFE